MRKSPHVVARKKKPRGHIIAKGIVSYDLTKIDVAEALLVAAIRLFFEDGHPVPIYQLASSAREILTTLGDKTGVETVLHSYAKKKGLALGEVVKLAHTFAGFFKHADRNPTAKLHFSEDEVDSVLAMACHDFGRVTGGMPIEAQIFEVWIYALAFKRVHDAPVKGQRLIKLAIEQFPGIRTADRKKQKRLGLDVLQKLKDDPELQTKYSREVKLAQAGPSTSSKRHAGLMQ
jgi:hypothetical protein